jgi:putative tryptophan/tyrosine transport system substrate-binding protein
VRRREFIALLGGAAAWPLAARAQERERMSRVGVLVNLSENDPDGLVGGFVKKLELLGWSGGRNVRIDVRWGAGDRERYRSLAAELVGLMPDVVLAATSDVVAALQRASQGTPIIFVGVIDPIGSGLVASMARPGGSATGFTVFEYAIAAKWMELLKEIAPSVTRVAVLRDANVASGIGQFAAVQTVAPIGTELSAIGVRNPKEVESALATLGRDQKGGLIVTASGFGANHPELIATLAARHNVPAVYPFRYFARAGGRATLGQGRAYSAARDGIPDRTALSANSWRSAEVLTTVEQPEMSKWAVISLLVHGPFFEFN